MCSNSLAPALKSYQKSGAPQALCDLFGVKLRGHVAKMNFGGGNALGCIMWNNHMLRIVVTIHMLPPYNICKSQCWETTRTS